MKKFFNDIVVIGDFHIQLYDKRTEIIKDFFNDIVKKFNNLIILGDFFEFFYSFLEVFPKGYLEILKMLKDYSERMNIFYIEGNHDFGLKDLFNISIFQEKFIFKIEDKKFLLLHGDTVDRSDIRYRFLRKFLRSNTSRFLMNNLPPYVVLKISRLLSDSSEKYLRKTINKDELIEIFKNSHIIKEDFNNLISGHFHINLNFEIGEKKIFILNGVEENSINYLIIGKNGEVFYRKWKY